MGSIVVASVANIDGIVVASAVAHFVADVALEMRV